MIPCVGTNCQRLIINDKMEGIKNIIFDLGGVIMDIDVKQTIRAFSDLGMKNIHDYFGHGFAASFFQ